MGMFWQSGTDNKISVSHNNTLHTLLSAGLKKNPKVLEGFFFFNSWLDLMLVPDNAN